MKPIKLNEDIKKKAFEVLTSMLENYNGDEGLNIKITPEVLFSNASEIQKPRVYITAEAYLKIKMLIDSSTDELAWHGTVTKMNSNYLINNIMVYPQTVTSTTVDANDEEYAKWLMELDDDVINKLRFQGHSHVNMPVSPSGRDTTNWQSFLNLLKEDEFYLFCIANKKDQFYWTIYDMADNIIYENTDIEMIVIDTTGYSLKTWVSDSTSKNITKQRAAHEFARGYTGTQTPVKPSPIGYTRVITKPVDDTGPVFDNLFDEYIPTELLNEAGMVNVGYDIETDTYYADGPLPSFTFDNTWGAYTCAGIRCRSIYGTVPKNSAGKNKTKTTGKRGRPPKKR